MKKTLFILTILIALSTNAQKTIQLDTYTLSYFTDHEPYSIEVSYDKKNRPIFWIEAQPTENVDEKIFIKVEAKYIPLFKEIFTESKEKYLEWSDVAIKNDVDEMSKKIKTNNSSFAAKYVKYNTYYMSNKVLIESTFILSEDVNNPVLLVSNKYTLKATSNQFITHKGFLIPFSSEKEINTFLETLSIEKANKALSKVIKEDDLFID